MTNIYEQHSNAFAHVSAYVVLRSGDHVARIAFKRSPTSGRVWCYFHVLGSRMVRAYADRGGYDKHSAAACSAASRLAQADGAETNATIAAVRKALERDGGNSWNRYLEDAGFRVLQAV